VRGDVHELKPSKRATGHEQRGPRYAVVVQSDDLVLSTLIVAPTSTSATPTSFRPEVLILKRRTRVLVEQTGAVDAERLGRVVGHLSHDEMRAIELCIGDVLGLP
jgi:mRNA interferase MazF